MRQLLPVLGRLESPNEGGVHICGTDIPRLAVQQIGKAISFRGSRTWLRSAKIKQGSTKNGSLLGMKSGGGVP